MGMASRIGHYGDEAARARRGTKPPVRGVNGERPGFEPRT